MKKHGGTKGSRKLALSRQTVLKLNELKHVVGGASGTCNTDRSGNGCTEVCVPSGNMC